MSFEKARQVGATFNEEGRSSLIAAAYLHDIGYAPSLQRTGFHPLDSASHLRAYHQERLASLVAYHSEVEVEAALRGLDPELAEFPRETSVVADALTYCDLTTSAEGMPVSFQERLADILRRYVESSLVARAMSLAQPALARVIKRVHQDDQKEEAQRLLPP